MDLHPYNTIHHNNTLQLQIEKLIYFGFENSKIEVEFKVEYENMSE